MTKEELIKLGFREELCRVGYLYFKGDFFCKLKDDGSVDFRVKNDDMNTFGIVHNAEEIKELEKEILYSIKRRIFAKSKEFGFFDRIGIWR